MSFSYPGTLSLSEKELLEFYNNPNNFPLKDPRIEEKKENIFSPFPGNCIVLLTHGSYYVPSSIRHRILFYRDQVDYILGKSYGKGFINRELLRLLKNFSDFGTGKMVKYAHIPKNNLIKHKGSRLIGDPNRSREAEDFIRKADFSGNIIASDLQKYQQEGERKHKEYHNTIEKKLLNTQEELGGVVAFDIHDTGVRLMDMNPRKDTFRKGSFPLITLGTRDGKSCNEEIVHYFSSRIEYYLGIEPLLNIPYKGGYVTQKHGELYRKERNTNRRNVIQVEIGRYLYMQESTQAVDIDRMKIIAAGLRMAITDTGNKFNKEYFRNL